MTKWDPTKRLSQKAEDSITAFWEGKADYPDIYNMEQVKPIEGETLLPEWVKDKRGVKWVRSQMTFTQSDLNNDETIALWIRWESKSIYFITLEQVVFFQDFKKLNDRAYCQKLLDLLWEMIETNVEKLRVQNHMNGVAQLKIELEQKKAARKKAKQDARNGVN